MSPRRNWDSPPTPLLPASVPLPPEPGEGGQWGTLSCGWGVGGVPIPTTGKKLSTLPTLWSAVSQEITNFVYLCHYWYFAAKVWVVRNMIFQTNTVLIFRMKVCRCVPMPWSRSTQLVNLKRRNLRLSRFSRSNIHTFACSAITAVSSLGLPPSGY